MNHLTVLAIVSLLAACGGGSTTEERALYEFEKCNVRLSDSGTCPVDQIEHEVPHFGELRK